MKTHTRLGLREQDRLDGSSNFGVWKLRIFFLFGEYGLKEFNEKGVGEPSDLDKLRLFQKNMAKAKRMILYGLQDHVIHHVVVKNIPKEMWYALV